ncbi:two-component system response regulator protein [Citrobacter koseri]|uniref:Two-component system response regulator protein n=1 Tax=Citrobacter koseri TaxID=545 RepID=A0A2X2X6K3_CITKO|nr:two-component system response regulator protein [Citrobacter koseri]
MIRVVLVDDHVVVRSGFAQLLSLEDDLDVAGQYSSAAEAWPALLRDDVNVAVLDIADAGRKRAESVKAATRAKTHVSRHRPQHLRHASVWCKARWMQAPAAI